MSGTSSVDNPRKIRMARLAMASLCRRNRRHASWRVESTRSWKMAGGAEGAVLGTSTGSGWVAAGTRSISSCSRIADPRVQDRVQDVRDQVEHDDEEDRHHHPGQDLLVVPPEEGVHEEPPHARV